MDDDQRTAEQRMLDPRYAAAVRARRYVHLLQTMDVPAAPETLAAAQEAARRAEEAARGSRRWAAAYARYYRQAAAAHR